MDIIINKELQSLLPPLTSEEYRTLEESLLVDGCRDPLIVWNNILVDGHNRLEICAKHGINYSVEEIQAGSIEDIKIWIIDNQKGRRNLTDGWKFELAQVRKEILLKQGREKQSEAGKLYGEGHPKEDLSTIDKSSHDTRKEIADELGWSTGKVAMADKVWKEAKPEVKDKIKSGELTFNQVYQDIKRDEKVKQRHAIIEETKRKIEAENLTVSGTYDVIAIDPPWAYEERGGTSVDAYEPVAIRGQCPYPTMTLAEIGAIKLPSKDSCVLFLWTTHAFLEDAFKLLDVWGFNYKATIVWDKDKMGMGRTIRLQCEFCLLAIKGSPVLSGSSERDIIREPRREHSRKPEAFYTMVERMTMGRRLDYFARSKRENWDVYGAETEKF